MIEPKPVKRVETPAWIVYLALVISLTVFSVASYVSIATYQNSQNNIKNTAAIKAVVTGHDIDIQSTADNALATRKAAEAVNAFAAYISAYLEAICKATPGCVAPSMPNPEINIQMPLKG